MDVFSRWAAFLTPTRLLEKLLTSVAVRFQTNMDRCTYLVLDEADRMLDMCARTPFRSALLSLRFDSRKRCLLLAVLESSGL